MRDALPCHASAPAGAALFPNRLARWAAALACLPLLCLAFPFASPAGAADMPQAEGNGTNKPLPLPQLPDIRFDDTPAFDGGSIVGDLCRKALEAYICKDDGELSLIREQRGAYEFNGFYGSKIQEFYCHVMPDHLVLSGAPWGKVRVGIPYHSLPQQRCLKARIGKSMCGRPETVTACESAP